MAGLDRTAMQNAVNLLLEYEEFSPFCKTKSDVFTMKCKLSEAHWVFTDTEWTFHISANRFLRGMVRLIVGMSLRVGEGKLSLNDVRYAMENQTRLPKPWSAPAAGLYLSEIEYVNKSKWFNLS